MRRFRFSPLTRFKLLSFIGFIFFAVCISFILIYFDDIDSFMLTNKRFNEPGSEEKFGLRESESVQKLRHELSAISKRG